YAPAAAVYEMVESILLDRKRVLPCAVYLQGEYRTRDLFVGVPVVLGAGGMERVIEIKLTAEEQTAFDKSAGAVKELVEALARLGSGLPGSHEGCRARPGVAGQLHSAKSDAGRD